MRIVRKTEVHCVGKVRCFNVTQLVHMMCFKVLNIEVKTSVWLKGQLLYTILSSV
jgi:hypothetical protein